MKSIAVAVAITLIAASSALAAPKRASQLDRGRFPESKAMVVESESHDVYVDGRLIGRDPDPAIRFQLRNDFYHRSGR